MGTAKRGALGGETNAAERGGCGAREAFWVHHIEGAWEGRSGERCAPSPPKTQEKMTTGSCSADARNHRHDIEEKRPDIAPSTSPLLPQATLGLRTVL